MCNAEGTLPNSEIYMYFLICHQLTYIWAVRVIYFLYCAVPDTFTRSLEPYCGVAGQSIILETCNSDPANCPLPGAAANPRGRVEHA